MIDKLRDCSSLDMPRLPHNVLHWAGQHVLSDGSLLAANHGRGTTRKRQVPLQRAWQESGIPGGVRQAYLDDSSGQWLSGKPADEILQATTDSWSGLEAYLLSLFLNLYQHVVQPRLNATSNPDHGFNDHSMVHINDLLKLFSEVLEVFGGFSEQFSFV